MTFYTQNGGLAVQTNQSAGLSFLDYLKKMAKGNYSPGLDAIDSKLSEVYGSSIHSYYSLKSEATCETSLEGFRIYQSTKGYFHIISLGMSQLFPKESSFGKRYSKYGYEMSVKIKANSVEECRWMLNKMIAFADRTSETECYFVEDEIIYGYGKPLTESTELTTLMLTEDDELGKLDTVHGEVQFLQFVAMTEQDAKRIKNSTDPYEMSQQFLKAIEESNPNKVIDLSNRSNYL